MGINHRYSADYSRRQPRIISLHLASLVETVKAVHLSLPQPQRDKALNDMDLTPHAGHSVATNLTRALEDDKPARLSERLAWLDRCASAHLYDGHLLWTKTDASNSYRLLIELVNALGVPTAPWRDGSTERQAQERHAKLARFATRTFGELLGATCLTLFCWNRAEDRTEFLYAKGCRFPETMTGLVWVDAVPRQLLLNHGVEDGPVVVWKRGMPACPQTSGSFAARERIGERWAIPLSWDRSRLAMFLNWRTGELPRYDVRDLHPAARYLIGWLASAGVDLNQRASPICHSPQDVVADLGAVFEASDEEGKGRALEIAARRILQIGQRAHYAVHWVVNSADGRPALQLRHGDYEGFPSDPQPEFTLEGPVDEVVDRCVALQCARWGATIRIPSMNARIDRTLPRNVDRQRTWREIDVARARRRDTDWESQSQIVVPIKRGGRVVGVINVEHPDIGGLRAEHAQRLELLSNTFALLEGVWAKRGSGRSWDFVKEQFNTASLPGDAEELLCRLCEHVCIELNANFVAVVRRDRFSGSFRSIATHFDATFRAAELERYGESAKPPTDRQLKRDRRKTPARRSQEQSLTDRMLTDAVRGQLTPRRRGLSHAILRTRKAAYVWATSSRRQLRPIQWTRDRFATVAGLPLAADETGPADAVVWIHWIRQPWELVGLEAGEGREPTALEGLFGRTIEERLQSTLEAVSAMHMLFRYSGTKAE
jgi:GAF domain